ncbi:MAG: hypothetical protein Q8K64_02090 [Sediminibacterium sp.]|nr:MAG: hypothetical protein FD183_1125 [Chitinophagaceae bacterium]MDP1842182.1 hypothetical protein [Sediminibacterium sp.]TXT34270.1 MAG: hypothetical protein FD136_416 [Chitinophagaceae bacterium]
MNYLLIEILSYSIGVSAFIALFKWKSIQKRDYFFIAFLWVGLLSEFISTFCIQLFKTNAVTSNIYIFISTLLLFMQFNRWGLFDKYKQLYLFIIAITSAFWFWENFIYSSIFYFGSFSRILNGFFIVLMSIHLLNILINQENTTLTKNPIFLICISFILFYTLKILVEIFWIYGLNASNDFRQSIYRIVTYVNLVVNIFYAIAVLWMPKKREFTWQ